MQIPFFKIREDSMKKFTAPFIKTPAAFDAADQKASPAPIFRKRFYLDRPENAVLRFCGLGYGYCHINGKKVSEDLLCAPVSEYDKLVWYSEYDITKLLNKGENIIAVILGNGFFNEAFESTWGHYKAKWRDNPKFALELTIGGETLLESDESFLCTDDSFITYNHLRSGETFDARLYDENWKALDFNDSNFKNAVADHNFNPERVLCECEPIRECEEYDFISLQKTEEGYLLDFGVNMSGYVRVCVDEAEGTEISLSHAEEAYDDGRLKLNKLDIFYPTVDFQVDRYICGKKKYSWSPEFTYHGFRFVLVKGLTKPPQIGEFKAVFAHQDVKRTSSFECSNELINKIYNAGIRSVYSNLHYALTDCPTREKLGWTNDAQASFEQLYYNFDIKKFMDKWGRDFLVSMKENGELPAIIPSHGWGFGHGPVADGALFTFPVTEYRHTGDASKLIEYLPFFERHYNGFKNGDTASDWWLGDWNGHINFIKDIRFLELFFTVKYCDMISLAYTLSGKAAPDKYALDKKEAVEVLRAEYITPSGESAVADKSVISMLISLNFFETPMLVKQLKKLVERDNYSINYGMLCLQYIYDALSDNGEAQTAYKLITSKGKFSYAEWFRQGATTLWETFEMGHTDSRNHHMLSAVIAWFYKYLLGIAPDINAPGYKKINLKPAFIKDLEYCKGSVITPFGTISVNWQRKDKGIEYTVLIPNGIEAYFRSELLKVGNNTFFINE